MRRPNHASRFEGTAKTKLQASRASDTETLQSQVNKAAKKRLSLSGLEVLHGRLSLSLSRAREPPIIYFSVTTCHQRVATGGDVNDPNWTCCSISAAPGGARKRSRLTLVVSRAHARFPARVDKNRRTRSA